MSDPDETLDDSSGVGASDTGAPDASATSSSGVGLRAIRDDLPAGVLPERYRVIAPIGRGGMGVVVIADDHELGRTVAVKIARPGVELDGRRRRRFLAEARATAQLEHPSIVPVYDVIHGEGGALAFTMRYVEGRSLAQVIAALRVRDPKTTAELTTTELLITFLKVCDAVGYAHDRGVLHRDLKPENVMLGRFGEVFVMDWGLASARAARSARPVTLGADERDKVLTMPGTIVGTPGYVSPEQVRGDVATTASEIFSLGAMLYELMTCERAIAGDLPAAILANTIVQPIVPPRERAPDRGISETLEAIAMRALAAEPADRFASVLELRRAIAREIDEAHREAIPPSPSVGPPGERR
jgi:serine/threonine protein kinase